MLRTLHQRTKPLTSVIQRSLLSSATMAGPSNKTTAILTGLSDSVTLSSLQNALKDVQNTRKIELQPGCSIHYLEHEDAATVAHFLNKSNFQATIGGASIPSLELKNIPFATSSASLLEGFSQFKPVVAKLFNLNGAEDQISNRIYATVRFRSVPGSIPNPQKLFKQSLLGNSAFQVSEPMLLNKPALYVRNIKHLDESKISKIFENYPSQRIQYVRTSKDGFLDMAIVYFNSEEKALKCLSELKETAVDGKRLTLAYREIGEPVVVVKNLPLDTKKNEIFKLLPAINIQRFWITKHQDSAEAIVVFDNEHVAEVAALALGKENIRGNKLDASVSSVQDVGFQIAFDASSSISEQELTAHLNEEALSVSFSTDAKSLVGFKTLEDARMALSSFQLGNTLPMEGAQAKLSVLPSYVVEVDGLQEDSSVASLLDTLRKNNLNGDPIRTDRNAIVKFRRNMDVIPGIKAMKKIEIDGNKVRAERYSPLNIDFQSNYDFSNKEEVFDEYSLKTLLKDSLGSDPATRYQIARNAFERALNDAKALGDINQLLDDTLPAKVKEEAKELLGKRGSSSSSNATANQRLFEIFLQREDMLQFSRDFKDFEALFGPANPSNPFDWSQFRVESNEEAAELFLKSRELGDAAVKKQVDTILGESALAEGEIDIGDGIVIKSSGSSSGDKQASSLESPTMLRDKEGRLWSGVVLDTDMVQKSMPGQRVGTHRALVVVGNMRGSAGYGMGKGKTSGDAINAAFRSALRNLIHIDLYENYGLAHDLHGKHNSCHAYIRATPRSRVMVSSNFASSILLRFGIGSASVKLVGRRDPYSMVLALFDALSKHQNIDEFAKARGKRYLTLKWAQDNGL